MRLLNTETLELEFFSDDAIQSYAILSHRWQDEEVTLQDLGTTVGHQKKGYEKIKRCCALAKANGYDHVWIDTCTIDKSSSAELSEAINSMYRWYEEADVCYAYLADVPSKGQLAESEWFTRGWTLQELIAPSAMEFLDENWQKLGTRDSLATDISKRTGIPAGILLKEADLEEASIAQRMSWAADRKTTRLEDSAYCLMGLFGINMPLLYGEGERAFVRLQEEILKISDDHSIFAWKTAGQKPSGLLATSPAAFKDSAYITTSTMISSTRPITISNKGIHLEVRFVGLRSPGIGLAILECTRTGEPDRYCSVYLRDMDLKMTLFERVESESLEFISMRDLKPSQCPIRRICVKQPRMTSTRKNTRTEDGLTKSMKGTTQSMSGTTDEGPKTSIPRLTNTELVDQLHYLRNMQTTGTNDEQRTPLSLAAEEGDENEIWLLLTRSDARTNHADDQGRTAIWYAVDNGNEAAVKLLLSRDTIRADLEDKEGRTPLSQAVIKGYHSITRLLLYTGKVTIDSKDSNGRSPLLWSVIHNQEQILKSLLAHGADIEIDDDAGQTPLSHAAEQGNDSILALLLQNGAKVDSTTSNGRTPLFYAAKNGHETVFVRLMDAGASLETQDRSGRTPLFDAVENGHNLILRRLLEKGLNPSQKSKDGRTPLTEAVGRGNSAAVQCFLESGADIESTDEDGSTPLLYAAAAGHQQIARVLLDHGAQIDAVNAKGSTPLLAAVRTSRASMAEFLLERGATAQITDKRGYTPLMLAAIGNLDTIVELLLAKGADPHQKLSSGWTPMQQAVAKGYENIVRLMLRTSPGETELNEMFCESAEAGKLDLVRLFLDHDADVHYQTDYGSALKRAVYRRKKDVVKLLLDSGADAARESEYVNIELNLLMKE